MMHCLVPNFIEENNWDHSTEKKHSRKREWIDALANAKPKQAVKRNYLKYCLPIALHWATL
jgi:hypothetical protein